MLTRKITIAVGVVLGLALAATGLGGALLPSSAGQAASPPPAAQGAGDPKAKPVAPAREADEMAAVTAWQGGRGRTFAGGLNTLAEGLVLAFLGSCTSDMGEATKAAWEAARGEDHLHVRYPRPRVVGATVEGDKLEVAEIVVSCAPNRAPRRVIVRSGDKYREFSKYDHRVWTVLEERVLAPTR